MAPSQKCEFCMSPSYTVQSTEKMCWVVFSIHKKFLASSRNLTFHCIQFAMVPKVRYSSLHIPAYMRMSNSCKFLSVYISHAVLFLINR